MKILLVILGVLALLYYIQIIAGLFTMSDWEKYPELSIDELESIAFVPFKLYYVMIFTKKLNTK